VLHLHGVKLLLMPCWVLLFTTGEFFGVVCNTVHCCLILQMQVWGNDVSSLPDVTLFTALTWMAFFKIKKNVMINIHTEITFLIA